MFIEVTEADGAKNKILLNVRGITVVKDLVTCRRILMDDGDYYEVIESYDELKATLQRSMEIQVVSS